VLNNRDLNMVTWEQRVTNGDPKNEASQPLPDVNYAKYAELLGLEGRRVEHPADLDDAWRQALEAKLPFVLDVKVDADVPMLPPHISVEQGKALVRSMLRGDVDRAGVVRRAFEALFPKLAPKS
jgi:pyruvate dehydrogenase (quinone)